MIRRALASLVLCLILLCAGIYVGAHPSGCRASSATRSSATPTRGSWGRRSTPSTTRTTASTARTTCRTGRSAGRSGRSTTASATTSTPTPTGRSSCNQNGQFAGIGVEVTKDPDGLKIAKVYDNSPASGAKLRRRRRDHRRRHVVAAGQVEDASIALIQGRLGTDGEDDACGAAGATRTVTLTRSNIDVPVVASRREDGRRQEARDHRASSQFSSGAHGEVAAALQKQLRDRRQGVGLRPARQPGRAGDRGAAGRVRVPEGRQDRHDQGPLGADADAGRDRRRDRADAADGRAGRQEQRERGGDRRGRAAGPQARGARRDAGRSARASSRRSSTCPTAARSTSPRASTSCRRGATSAARAPTRAPGLTPDVKAQDNPKTTNKDEGLDKALDVLAAKAS